MLKKGDSRRRENRLGWNLRRGSRLRGRNGEKNFDADEEEETQVTD